VKRACEGIGVVELPVSEPPWTAFSARSDHADDWLDRIR
jgi:hypothetical protein